MTCYETLWLYFRAFLYNLSPVLLAKYRFTRMTGKRLNLENPQSFDEKLLWLMLYWRHPLKTRCADKYTMRSYVKEHALGHTLPELLGVYASSREMDFATFPERFVLKCTHGCGFNILCEDKSKLDVDKARRRLDRWMKTDISKIGGEIHYAQMKPRIICEGYMSDSLGNLPSDYKVYCFNGKAHCTMVCTDRSSGNTKFYFYDREWKHKLAYDKSSLLSDRNFPKPEAYEEIIHTAEKLSKPFPFVRMDFYSINGKALIGEMTFTPNACIDTELTDLAQHKLGKLIELPEKYLE